MVADESTRAAVEARFWVKVAKAGANECWPWIGAKRRHGYGDFHMKGATSIASRVAYMLHHGQEIPPGMHVLHLCDNPPCCNPAHLMLGTHQQNMRQMSERNRLVITPEHRAAISAARSGQPLSDEHKLKFRLAKLGKPSKRRRQVVLFGVSYASITAAAAANKRSRAWALDRILAGDGHYA